MRQSFEWSATPDELKAYLETCKPEHDNFVFIKTKNENDTQRHVLFYHEPLKQLLTDYAIDQNTSVKSLRIKHKNKTVLE